MSKSSNYWKNRAISLEALMQTNTNQTMIAINKIYSKASESLTRSINKIFTRYVTGGKINPEYAKQLLNERQTREYRNKLKALLAETEDENLRRDIINTLDAPAYGARISRMEALRDNLYYQARAIGAKEVKLVEDRLVNVIEQSYYRTIYADQVNSGIYDFDIISDRKIQAMLAHEWEGGNYSSRLWNNNKEFADKVANTLEVGCLAGWTLDEMCAELKGHVIGDTSDKGQRFITSRLVRTEVNYFSNQGTLEGFKAAGFTKYRFIATLDLRTSKICRSLDMKEFDISEAEIGVNLPPMHPFCRSVIVPAYEGENRVGRTRWARDPKTGRGMYVPADMSYDDWYKKYVSGNGRKSSDDITYSKATTNKVRENRLSINIIENRDVHYIGKLDKDIYKCITDDIATDEVIITEERISHIKDHHPGHFEIIEPFLQTAIDSPDYIFEDAINTGLILKHIAEDDLRIKIVLRIHTSADPEGFKNSIISAWKIGEKRWDNYVNNKKVLYKSE